MLNLFAALLGWKASDSLSHDIAKQNERDKPNCTDRLQSAMSTILPISVISDIYKPFYHKQQTGLEFVK